MVTILDRYSHLIVKHAFSISQINFVIPEIDNSFCWIKFYIYR